MNKFLNILIACMTCVLPLSSQFVYANPGEGATKQDPVEVVASDEDEVVSADVFEPGKWIDKAVLMLEEQMTKSPDKRIPQTLLDNAQCVVLFPEIVQAGFAVGGKFGRGMVSCRNINTDGWGTPVFLRLTSVNWGAQIGAQSADVIMLIMNDDGLDTLFAGKPLLGAGAGIAAGPVGRDTTANIDVMLKTPIVTYTRSKGLYIGAILEGVAITPAKTVNRSLYGQAYPDARSLLHIDINVPDNIAKLQTVLAAYSAAATDDTDDGEPDEPDPAGEAGDVPGSSPVAE
jgi:lipid-binding SYLF domain-containing protein